MLRGVEFYRTPFGKIEVHEPGKPVYTFEQHHKELTEVVLSHIETFYAKAYEGLHNCYKNLAPNRTYQRYVMATRFIRCNFSEYDQTPDVDHTGTFRLEFVNCPMRGECKWDGIICRPKFTSTLTARETEIMKCYYNSESKEEIADKLFISIETVKQHKRNALKRLGLHSLPEFISYASKNRMFENQ